MTFWDRVVSENKENSIYVISYYIDVLMNNNRIKQAFDYANHYAKESNYEHIELLYQIGKIYLLNEDYENASKYFDIVYSRNSKKQLELYLLSYLANVRANNKEKSNFYYNLALKATNLTPEEFEEQFVIYGRNFDKAIEETKLQTAAGN
jgi:tetratricopeptide (TPR) repeat protein